MKKQPLLEQTLFGSGHGMVAGVEVKARKPDTKVGKTTGSTRRCQMEGCGGIRIGVRWPDGKLTWLCSKSLGQTKTKLFLR